MLLTRTENEQEVIGQDIKNSIGISAFYFTFPVFVRIKVFNFIYALYLFNFLRKLPNLFFICGHTYLLTSELYFNNSTFNLMSLLQEAKSNEIGLSVVKMRYISKSNEFELSSRKQNPINTVVILTISNGNYDNSYDM